MTSIAFSSQDELVDEWLELFAARLRAVGEGSIDWCVAHVAAEQEIGQRARASDSAILPITRVARLDLGQLELRVLWLLLAHELSPLVRGQVRALATETALDPSGDLVLRIAVGRRSSRAWQVLQPQSALRRFRHAVGAGLRNEWRAHSQRRVEGGVHGGCRWHIGECRAPRESCTTRIRSDGKDRHQLLGGMYGRTE